MTTYRKIRADGLLERGHAQGHEEKKEFAESTGGRITARFFCNLGRIIGVLEACSLTRIVSWR